MEMERIVKTYYDGLEEGKLLGRKCVECGAIEFPPVIQCNACSCPDTEWVELSHEAELLDFTFPGLMAMKPTMEPFMPYAFGSIKIEGVPQPFLGVIVGMAKENKQEYLAKLPLKLKAKIVQMDGYKTLFYEIAE